MASEPQPGARNVCPHCGKRPGLKWWYLLPSNNTRRVLKCVQCGGRYDLSDTSKIASIFGGLLGVGPAIIVLGKIVKYGHGQIAWIGAGTAVAAGIFMAGSLLLAWVTSRIVPKS